jgi:hypothetical protein
MPSWERLWRALESLSGLQITGIDEDVWKSFEELLLPANALLQGYNFNTHDELQLMSAEDVSRALASVNAAANCAIDAELDRIVATFDQGIPELPVAAIREAREHRELMIPRLVRVLHEATAAARDDHVPEGNAHFFALFLLTEFQAAEAFPAILEAISLPSELPHELFGDAVTSTLSRVLAQFTADNTDVLDRLIADREVNEYVRWAAAQTYIHHVRDGRLSRSDAVQRLRQHLRDALDQEDTDNILALVCELADLSPSEAMDEITEAYDRDLVDSFLIKREDVELSIAKGEFGVQESLERCPPTGIADTIEELQRWAGFQDEPVKKSVPPRDFIPASPVASQMTALSVVGRTRIGRNDPCPCGSGKKFKKCCGRVHDVS